MTIDKIPTDGTMPLMAHLDELRKRLLRYFVVLVICVLCSYAFRKEILDFVRKPVEGPLKKYASGQLLEVPKKSTKESSPNLTSLNQYDCACQEEVKKEAINDQALIFDQDDVKESTLLEDPSKDSDISSMQLDSSVDLNQIALDIEPIEDIKGIPIVTTDTEPGSEIINKVNTKENGVISSIRDSVIDFIVYFQVLLGKDPTAIESYSDQSEWAQDSPELVAVTKNPEVLNLQCSCTLKTNPPSEKVQTTSSMVFIGLPELFFAQMKIAIYAGFFFSLPFLFIEAWKFIGPALFKDEKKFFWLFVSSAYICFIGGALFGYVVVFPFGFDFFLSLSQPGEIMPSLSIGGYLSFAIKMLLAFGTIFELPVVVFILARLGMITPEMMVRQARVAILMVFILSAILTPPDPFTMSLMAVPLILLYFISIGICYVGVDRKKAALRKQGLNPEDSEL